MPSEKQLTVVIPVYNRAEKVRGILGDLSAQTTADFRVVLVDNNSTDSTLEVLQQWSEGQELDVEIIQQLKPGASAARNVGLAVVTTRWTLFFDSDDRMAPSHIERVLRGIAAYPQADILGWNVNHVLASGELGLLDFEADQYRALFNGTMATQRYCARTELFRRAGGWNESVGLWDDIELGARLLALNPRTVKLVGEPTVTVIVGDDSITRRERADNMSEIDRALEAMERTLGPGHEHWVALKRVIQLALDGADPSQAIARSPRLRALLRAAYWYTLHGGRGVARILRPLFD